PKYSLFERWVENGLLDLVGQEGVGCIPFSPLAQGLLTDKYLHGIPNDSRVAKGVGFLKESQLTPARLRQIGQLNDLAQARGQSLAQMALAWILKDERVTSVLIGASRPAQLLDSLRSLDNTRFDAAELTQIEAILAT
ncbi:aldo/keto reductase, partial [Hymenobacter crusticola]